MKFNLDNHIVGRVYDLTQENMNAMIETIEQIKNENARLREALERIDNECGRDDTIAWSIANDALEELK